jgi:hypothetical protein
VVLDTGRSKHLRLACSAGASRARKEHRYFPTAVATDEATFDEASAGNVKAPFSLTLRSPRRWSSTEAE